MGKKPHGYVPSNMGDQTRIVTKGLLDNALQTVLAEFVKSQNVQDFNNNKSMGMILTEITALRKILLKKNIITEDEYTEVMREVLIEIDTEVKKARQPEESATNVETAEKSVESAASVA